MDTLAIYELTKEMQLNKPKQKITRAEALARAKEGEQIQLITCPHCGELIAAYIKTDPPEASEKPAEQSQ